MKNPQSFDVVVVGGGPGGAAAAKHCADQGLTALLVEKRELPRDKVCSGMIMGEWALEIIRKEFGEIPPSVFTDPPLLSGHRFYVGMDNKEELTWPTALTWRKDLDFWMVQRAVESGVQLEEGTRVSRMKEVDGNCRITLLKRDKTEEVHSRFVIGADGATSVVRRSIFPELKIRFSGPMRECYQGALDLDRNFFHWFFPKNLPRPRFNVNHKGDVFLIEGAALRVLRTEIVELLSRYGFDRDSKPLWKDACTVPLLHEDLLSGAFQPAKGNVLLTGDAAGLLLPITFEGIGSALKSGILAADAVVEHMNNHTGVASSYLKSLAPMLVTIGRLLKVQDALTDASKNGPDFLAKALRDAYRETLTIQER